MRIYENSENIVNDDVSKSEKDACEERLEIWIV